MKLKIFRDKIPLSYLDIVREELESELTNSEDTLSVKVKAILFDNTIHVFEVHEISLQELDQVMDWIHDLDVEEILEVGFGVPWFPMSRSIDDFYENI